MSTYIDGFVFPILRQHLEKYQAVAQQVADIWIAYGAIDYCEFVKDDVDMEGTRSFSECLNTKSEEAIVFGWVSFVSKKARDVIHHKVATDPRMNEIIAPIMDPSKIIFDARKMVYGVFKRLVLKK